jgi:2',3'-cyclic-nucleotide 2'-phosphodiesterase (5'-nucleotidase family)
VFVLDYGSSLFADVASSTTDKSQGALPIEAMNAMQYDAMALGEKDLAAAAEIVSTRFQEASFPILSVNISPTDALPNIQPYILRQAGGHTVAIIGVTHGSAANRSRMLGISLTVQSAVETVQSIVGELRPQADVIILLSNLDQKGNTLLAQQVAGLDAIIGVYGGGQVKPTVVAGPDGQVVLHAAGAQAKSLGILELQFDAQGHVVNFTGQVVDLTAQFANDPGLLQILQKYGVQP